MDLDARVCNLLLLQYVIESFSEEVFSEMLNYLLAGSCAIQPSTVVGLACAAECYEVEELKQACFERLLECLTTSTICGILSQLEKYLSYSAAKTMVVQSLEFVDSHAADILCSPDFLRLSEHMVHLVMHRDMGTEVPELVKVNAAFAWGKLNAKPEREGENLPQAQHRELGGEYWSSFRAGQDFRSLVTPLVKQVRLHLIDPQDIMKVLQPSSGSSLFAVQWQLSSGVTNVNPNPSFCIPLQPTNPAVLSIWVVLEYTHPPQLSFP